MVLRIVRGASPVHTTDIAGENERALKTRRGEDSFGTGRLDLVGAPLALFRFYAPGVFRPQFFRNHRNGGLRLRRPGFFTGDIALEHRAFLYGEERSTSKAIEDEYPAHFCSDGDGGRTVLPGEKRGLRCNVVIPQIVMNHLEAPDKFARAGTESHNGVGPLVVTLADAAVIIGAGAAGRDENQVALDIHRDSGPSVSRASPRRGLVGPGRNGIPGPAESARANVEGANHAALHRDRAIVAHRGAGDDQVFEDGGSGGDLIVAWVAQSNAAREVNLSIRSEVGTWLSGGSVQSDQSCVEGANEDPQRARLAGFGTRSSPGRDTARRHL